MNKITLATFTECLKSKIRNPIFQDRFRIISQTETYTWLSVFEEDISYITDKKAKRCLLSLVFEHRGGYLKSFLELQPRSSFDLEFNNLRDNLFRVVNAPKNKGKYGSYCKIVNFNNILNEEVKYYNIDVFIGSVLGKIIGLMTPTEERARTKVIWSRSYSRFDLFQIKNFLEVYGEVIEYLSSKSTQIDKEQEFTDEDRSKKICNYISEIRKKRSEIELLEDLLFKELAKHPEWEYLD